MNPQLVKEFNEYGYSEIDVVAAVAVLNRFGTVKPEDLGVWLFGYEEGDEGKVESAIIKILDEATKNIDQGSMVTGATGADAYSELECLSRLEGVITALTTGNKMKAVDWGFSGKIWNQLGPAIYKAAWN